MPTPIHNVPTNIISGFLGVGKTTAILNLFSQKPADERWAVLVNEYGKVGIDGAVYQANGIAVKEIPGGCMCCAQGLPLQVAVNRLLAETKPQRLIIESSGVGHPGGVLKTLTGEGFKDVLKMKAGICLLDPRHLSDPAYQENELFNEQLQFSDVLLANKSDIASAEDLQLFSSMVETFSPAKQLSATITNGQLEVDWLNYDHVACSARSSPESILQAPAQRWQTQTFHYPGTILFDGEALRHFFVDEDKLPAGAIRMKGLIRTGDGSCLLNYAAGQFELSKLAGPTDNETADGVVSNRIEVIGLHLDVDKLEQALLACTV